MIAHTILRIGILKALNESVGKLLGLPLSTDKARLSRTILSEKIQSLLLAFGI